MDKRVSPATLFFLLVLSVASACSPDGDPGTRYPTSLPTIARISPTVTSSSSTTPTLSMSSAVSNTLSALRATTPPASVAQAGDMPPTLPPRYVTAASLSRTPTRSATPRPTSQVAQSGSGMSGTVKSVSGSTIQITRQDGSTLTVTTDAQTRFERIATASLSDCKSGTSIMVEGTLSGTTMVARSIQIGTSFGLPGGTPPIPRGSPPSGNPPARPTGQPGGFGGPRVVGSVKSVSGTTITVNAPNGSATTVQVNGQTTYERVTSATSADVQVGVHITVVGSSSNGSVVARDIQIGGTGQ
jgi:hypothetical protein